MTLEELNKLKSDAEKCERESTHAKSLSAKLAKIRNGDAPLMVAYKGISNWEPVLKGVIEGVINECGADLLRIVEMRQDAYARLKSEQARQKLAAIDAAIGRARVEGGSDGAA